MLIVNNVEKSFGTHHVLKGVSFSASKGEIYGLIGKNGAGKTTLINIIAGISAADSGECQLNGIPIKVSKNNINIGYLPDNPNFYEYLSTGEYLDFLLMNRNPDRRRELLELVDLNPDIKISTMSRGMRQRLGIAASIVGDPEILLLDEPTSALDPGGREAVVRILRELKKAGKTIILSTHILADMEKVCDNVGFLSDGVIKRSINICELDKGGKYIDVTFEGKMVDESIFRSRGIVYEAINNETYRFIIEDNERHKKQQALFAALSYTEVPISSIHSEIGTLDKVFQEVCE